MSIATELSGQSFLATGSVCYCSLRTVWPPDFLGCLPHSRSRATLATSCLLLLLLLLGDAPWWSPCWHCPPVDERSARCKDTHTWDIPTYLVPVAIAEGAHHRMVVLD